MGSKKKPSRVFGKGLGRHKKSKKQSYLGRPKMAKYRIEKGPKHTDTQLKLKIRRIRTINRSSQLRNVPTSSVYAVFSSGSNFKFKIRKIKDLSPKGYRIINLDCLQSHVSDITLHTCMCKEAIKLASEGKSPIKLETEIRRLGLATVMLARCEGCLKSFTFNSSPTVPGSKRYDVNVRAVWGSMVTGNGPAHLNEFMAALNSPGLSQTSFSAIETEISEWWHNVLEIEMLLAGQEERRLAVERGDFHEEVPAITVITDGGWSKRTHRHSFNAAGGVAIIIGKETKKLLHIGVRNKYCYLCNNDRDTPHTCFKNWDQDSQSMEADIILQGFLQAESKHGLRYMRMVGDGDSSVFARVREEVPGWGRYITKEECANHVCKCYRSNLEKLVTDNVLYKGKHHLSKTTRVRLVTAVRCAIRMRSKELKEHSCDKVTATRKLSHDIRNSVYHIFGQHKNCSDFCHGKKSNAGVATTVNTSALLDHEQSSSSCMDDQIDYWTEGTDIASQEEVRFGTSIDYTNIEQHIIKDVSLLLNRIAEKSSRLITNSTTNLAENLMHIRSKFDGGKVHNLCNRGSWHARCYGGALRMNLGPEWSCNVWQSATGTEPGNFFRRHYARQTTQLAHCNIYKSQATVQAKRWQKKMSNLKSSNTRKANRAYGPDATDVTNDVSTPELEKLSTEFYAKHVDLSTSQCSSISSATVQQSQSGLWHTERRKRLTASNFGSIVKRNTSLPVLKLVRNLLYSTFRGNRHTRNGLLHENTTIEEYKLKKAENNENVTISPIGLVIHPIHKFLAASPDGIVSSTSGDSGIIEIKNLLHAKPVNLWQASENKTFCLETVDGQLHLRENHNYYYQCHGLLNICDKQWIDFIVRTLNPYQMFIQRIYRDIQLWENIMLPKLKAFYYKAILPELACPREGKSPGIREPGLWYDAPNTKKPRRKNRNDSVQPTPSCSVTGITSSPTSAANCSHASGLGPSNNRKRRRQTIKFLGRTIKHQWVVDDSTKEKEWYKGTVVSVLSGTDGGLNSVYEVLYEGDDQAYEIDHLYEDYQSGSLQFCDI